MSMRMERPTLSAEVARHLLDLVSRERLRPGAFVPSEIQIGRELQVSRGSVREAYRTLAALGILEIESGRKPRLRAIDSKALAQVFDYAVNTAQVSLAQVQQTRRAIELQTAPLAARYATEAHRRVLRELLAEMRAAGSDRARRMASDSAIHSLIAQASGNPLNGLVLSALRSPVEASSRRQSDDDRSDSQLLCLIDAHEDVVESICAGDEAGAAAAMTRLFDMATP
jgi:GntR family transcriptional regulator, transcriptional repressor for pyruvate dehydrogenase complex